MPFEPSFIDQPESFGPFDGVLFVLNIGEDNYRALDITKEYKEFLGVALDDAHADGWAVIYLFDNTRGVSMPPEEFELTEGADFYRLMRQTVGIQEASFSRVYSQRRAQFESMLEHIWNHKDFRFLGRDASIAGLCKIGGEEVLLPVTQII